MSSNVNPAIPVSVYAALSAAAYADYWSDENKVMPGDLPSGWAYLPGYSTTDANAGVSLYSGFSASTFINASTNNIVISFEGTDFGSSAQSFSDYASDIALGIGIASTQLTYAALLYESVKSQYPNATISFTGHSLGAGLASVMAVWFNKSATVIDDAPFLGTADSTILATTTYVALALQGYNDNDLADFIGDSILGSDLPAVLSREPLVTAYYTQGEILNKVFGVLGNTGIAALAGTVYGANYQMSIGGGDGPSSILQSVELATSLHSVALATLLQMSSQQYPNSFQSDTFRLPTLVT